MSFLWGETLGKQSKQFYYMYQGNLNICLTGWARGWCIIGGSLYRAQKWIWIFCCYSFLADLLSYSWNTCDNNIFCHAWSMSLKIAFSAWSASLFLSVQTKSFSETVRILMVPRGSIVSVFRWSLWHWVEFINNYWADWHSVQYRSWPLSGNIVYFLSSKFNIWYWIFFHLFF